MSENNKKLEEQEVLVQESIESKISDVEYVNVNINDIKVQFLGRENKQDKYVAEIDGKSVGIGKRFWASVGSRFKLNTNMFRYFRPDEVFERVAQHHGADANVRLAVEKNKLGNFSDMLAVSSLDKKVFEYQKIVKLLQEHGGKDLLYKDGKITSTHMPASGEQAFEIGGDDMRHLFMVGVPVDGYGDSDITLALERFACANGMVGTGAFSSKVNVGKDNPTHGLMRAIDSYANEEQYEKLAEQYLIAQNTMASIQEANAVLKVISKLGFKPSARGLLGKFHAMTGNMTSIIGIASFEELPSALARTIATQATIYDLINFVTELATHHALPESQRKLQGLVGTMISGYYDLEGVEPEQEGEREHQALFIGEKGKSFNEK